MARLDRIYANYSEADLSIITPKAFTVDTISKNSKTINRHIPVGLIIAHLCLALPNVQANIQ